MREIKFRAWDAHKYCWLSHSDICNKLIYREDGWVGFLLSTLHLMQYTGITDKNGKEIYEGDIIRICHYEPWDESDPDDKPEFSVHEVKWGELAWVVNPTYSEEYNDLGMVGEGWEDGHLWMEVIGNIYENPELIK